MYINSKCVYFITIILLTVMLVEAWDSDQLEIFDLVEEINQNFYSVFNISQDADIKDVKKAFRSLSLLLHPDKNDSPDADVRFRQIVSIYDVLKDSNKRLHYDNVLKNGLPNWRSAVYYYRHVRKMGLVETLMTLFIVISIGQYLVAWGSYVEKKYAAEQLYEVRLKRATRKRGGNTQVPDLNDLLLIPKPSFLNTLPVQIPRGLWFLLKNIIPTSIYLYRWGQELYQKSQEPTVVQVEDKQEESFPQIRKRKKPGFVPMERSDDELPPPLEHIPTSNGNVSGQAPASGGLWTDDDLNELVQLVKKFPSGTVDRWEKIAESMQRTVPEVTYMTSKLKDNNYRLPDQDQEQESELAPSKQKTRGGKVQSNEKVVNWTQVQQAALEAALAKHPKGPVDRWERIAKCVPGKTKEECMLRYKHLVELVKKQKEKKQTEL